MPTTDRVLVEIVTAANMTGIKEAQAGFLGMSSALTATIAGLGLAVVAGKSAIDIAEQHEKAELSLKQAIDAHNSSAGTEAIVTKESTDKIAAALDAQSKAQDALKIAQNASTLAQLAYTDAVHKHGAKSEDAYKASLHLEDATIRLKQAQDALADATDKANKSQETSTTLITTHRTSLAEATAFLDKFIGSNRQYIKSQAEITEAYASLLRAGIDVEEAQKDLNRILDISAIKGRDVSDVTLQIIQAEHGRLKSLSDLGVTTTKFTDAEGNQVASSHDVAKAFEEVDKNAARGRETLTQTDQATRKLGNDWQDIANNVGPPLIQTIDLVAGGLDWVANELKKLGENKDFAKFISNAFGHWQDLVVGVANTLKTIIGDVQWLIDHGQAVAKVLGGGSGPATPARPRGLAAGGWASPYETLMVGERGPEMLVMGSQGGTVVPHGGGQVINIYIDHPMLMDGPSIDSMTNQIAQRLRFVTGT